MPKTPKRYEYGALFQAYYAVTVDGLRIAEASRRYGVPHSTLNDRVNGKVPMNCMSMGPAPDLGLDEEYVLAKHFEKMFHLGYGYTRKEVLKLASEYGAAIGVRENTKTFDKNWYNRFKKRHPFLKIRQPSVKSKSSEETVRTYFLNLQDTLQERNLLDKPHLIYNVGEKRLSPHHTPPRPVSDNYKSRKINNITTIISAGNALGNGIPPYFVFKGEEFLGQYIETGTPGVDGTMSESGYSNNTVFRDYLTKHFLKYMQSRNQAQSLLVICDGHKFDLTPDIIIWAEAYNIIISMLPAHSSHFMEPLDVSCFEPFDSKYVAAKDNQLESHSKDLLNYSEICKFGCSAYAEALQAMNLINGFKNTGIYPFKGIAAIDKNNFEPPADVEVDDIHCSI